MKNNNITLLLLALSFLITACQQTMPDHAIDLTGQTWNLAAYNDTQPIAGHQPTLQFDPEQISGTTGCNHYGGMYRIKGDTLHFEGVYNTEMACLEPGELMDQERVYLELLGIVDQFELNNDMLIFYAKAIPILVFEIQPEAPQSAEPIPEPAEPVSVDAVPTPTAAPLFVPPEGFNPYQDPVTGISVYIPEKWVVTGILEGQYAILQSYPENKYVGGEMREAGDTKCDLNIQPAGTQVDDLINQWKSSDITTILAEEEFLFANDVAGQRFEINSMGTSTTFIVEINERVVLLTCFGDFSIAAEIAATLQILE